MPGAADDLVERMGAGFEAQLKGGGK
jgi:hypothetical protein